MLAFSLSLRFSSFLLVLYSLILVHGLCNSASFPLFQPVYPLDICFRIIRSILQCTVFQFQQRSNFILSSYLHYCSLFSISLLRKFCDHLIFSPFFSKSVCFLLLYFIKLLKLKSCSNFDLRSSFCCCVHHSFLLRMLKLCSFFDRRLFPNQ